MRITHDNYIYAVDLVMVVTALERNPAGLSLRRILAKNLISVQMIHRNTGGKGNGNTQLLTPHDAIQLIMVLPGEMARTIRLQMVSILQRYCDGDQSLCEEVEENRRMGKRKSYEMFANNVIQNAQAKVARKAHEIPEMTFVYATKSPAFPGLIKIGKTIDIPKRLSSLNTSCAPAPHVIVAVAPSFDNHRDEQTTHAFFASARREGEFFELEDEVVKDYFATHITSQYDRELAQYIARVKESSV